MSAPVKYIINDFKQVLLSILPRPLASYIFTRTHHDFMLRKYIMNKYNLNLIIPHTMEKSYNGEYEAGITQWFIAHLRKEDLIFDLGACFGYFSALSTEICPEVEIHLFEPNWQNYIYLEKNFIYSGKRKNKWIINKKFAGTKTNRSTISLDDYCQRVGKTPTLVKMDVDGGEWDVMLGATALIEKRKTEFLIELHPWLLNAKGVRADDFLNLFPKDYYIKILPDLHKNNNVWSDDISLLYTPGWDGYVYAAPTGLKRM